MLANYFSLKIPYVLSYKISKTMHQTGLGRTRINYGLYGNGSREAISNMFIYNEDQNKFITFLFSTIDWPHLLDAI